MWIERAAALRPGRVAVEAEDGSLTYAELLARARAVAGGLGRGERVPITAPPGLAFAEALHGCLLAGAAAVPVDPRLARFKVPKAIEVADTLPRTASGKLLRREMA